MHIQFIPFRDMEKKDFSKRARGVEIRRWGKRSKHDCFVCLAAMHPANDLEGKKIVMKEMEEYEGSELPELLVDHGFAAPEENVLAAIAQTWAVMQSRKSNQESSNPYDPDDESDEEEDVDGAVIPE